MSRITESLYSKYGINERKPLREGMFDDIAEDLGYDIYDEDPEYGTMYTKTHYVRKKGELVKWFSTIEVTNDGHCYADLYDENDQNVGHSDSDSFEKVVKYIDKVISIRPNNPYVTIYESHNKKNVKRRRR